MRTTPYLYRLLTLETLVRHQQRVIADIMQKRPTGLKRSFVSQHALSMQVAGLITMPEEMVDDCYKTPRKTVKDRMLYSIHRPPQA